MPFDKMQKLPKNDEPVFLALVRASDSFFPHGRGIRGKEKESTSYAAVKFAHGMTEGQTSKINKVSGPKKLFNHGEAARTRGCQQRPCGS